MPNRKEQLAHKLASIKLPTSIATLCAVVLLDVFSTLR
jgi:hypothetical protein